MNWLDDMDALFWSSWAEVWREMRIARPVPRIIMPSPTHGTRALGRRYSKPVIRSWLGGRSIDPPHRLTTDLTFI